MKFWDSSAIVPLLVAEPSLNTLLEVLGRDQTMVAWWGTPVECASAIARREREGDLKANGATEAFGRLQALSAAWHEVLPSVLVRDVAQRLLRVHSLRAADALQLAAATIAAEHEPASLEFVCLDDRLNLAAQREGFPIVKV